MDQDQTIGHDIVVIGASAGGLTVLQELTRTLSPDLPISVFIVLHVPAEPPSLLAEILGETSLMRVISPIEGTAIRHGRIYVAPSNRHMMLTRGHVRLTMGAPENRHRPAIDPLFRSAALAYGPRVTGILLSGSLDDGTAGLRAVKACRGISMVQDPAQARYPGMAEHAFRHAQIDYCVNVETLARLIAQHAAEPVIDPDDYEPPEHLKLEVEFAFMESNMDQMKKLGTPSEFVCPTCHGSLTEIRDGDMLRYRCHTGHAFSAENLFIEQDQAVEEALFTAVRAIEENAALARRIAGTYGNRFPQQQAVHEDKARRLEQSALTLRKLIVGRNGNTVDDGKLKAN